MESNETTLKSLPTNDSKNFAALVDHLKQRYSSLICHQPPKKILKPDDITTYHDQDDERDNADIFPVRKALQVQGNVAGDLRLHKSVFLNSYLESYANNVFFIAPVNPLALDLQFVCQHMRPGSYLSEHENVILLNFYVALALGAKQCGAPEITAEYLTKAREKASQVFDSASYSAAEGLLALAVASFGENDWVRGGYYLVLAITICKSIGAVNSHVYMRGFWWRGLLPDTPSQTRLEMIREYNATATQPRYQHASQLALPAPITDEGLSNLNVFSRIMYASFTILSLSAEEPTTDQAQTRANLLDVLEKAEDEIRRVGEKFTSMTALAFLQCVFAFRAMLYWQLDAKLLALQWAYRFKEHTENSTWRFGVTVGMLEPIAIVGNIFLEMKEFDALKSLFINTQYLCQTDKTSRRRLEGLWTALNKNVADAEPPSPTKQVVVVEDEENGEQVPTTAPTGNTSKQRKRTLNGDAVDKKVAATQDPKIPCAKQSKTIREESTRKGDKTESSSSSPSSLSSSSVASSGRRKKKLEWYQWENNKLGVGGFNRESTIVQGERVFRIGKRKKNQTGGGWV